ncbi:iron-sulfur cluster biosynthesis family protein [Levilactobacillus yiduensis]|uniref:iron-sulfur cluster biosynthesis family protein n=1 Tax=Levilactobacillus yiduensis TaxID=2953880 RepID=UPI000EF32A1D|nr:iron-sulfur cluster biosynthesis family protein [Levilactobacillus yiduensis]AYM03176.1 iron-sulfur cluster biosynthesis family protein [Levilactobacillus brevis]
MAAITLSDALVAHLKQRQLADKELVLITDDGGGKYSLQGGACTIGTNFTVIVLDQPDPDYAVPLTNEAGLHLWTSPYDLIFLETGVTMTYGQGQISLKDDAHMLDNAVQIADGATVLAAFDRGMTAKGTSC